MLRPMVYEKYILTATVKLISICIMYLMFYEEPIQWILQFLNCNLHAHFHLCYVFYVCWLPLIAIIYSSMKFSA